MRSRVTLISVLLAAGLILVFHQHSRVARRQVELAKTAAEISALESERDQLREEVQALHEEFRRDQLSAEIALADLSKAQADFTSNNPSAQWAEPPEQLPDWNPESPFLWVSKEILTQIPMEPFSRNGELNPGVAEVLGIKPETRKELNQFMAAELQRFRNLELTNVYLSTNHLPGVSHIEKKMTIELRPPAEAGAQFHERLTAALVGTLGSQRAGILMEQGKGWFAGSVASFAAEPKVISVGWRPNNGYSLTIKGPGVWKSFGGISKLEGHVPDHLLPFFSDLTEIAQTGQDTE